MTTDRLLLDAEDKVLVSKPIGNNRTKEQGNNEDMKKKGVLKKCSCSYSKRERNILGITPSSVTNDAVFSSYSNSKCYTVLKQ